MARTLLFYPFHWVLAFHFVVPCVYHSLLTSSKTTSRGLHRYCWFFLRFCDNYKPLNSITLSFEFPVPRFVESIECISDSCESLSMISLYLYSDYHQVRVRKYDQEKLSYFTPFGIKICLKSYLLGSKNALAFYTTIMQTLCRIMIFLLLKQ